MQEIYLSELALNISACVTQIDAQEVAFIEAVGISVGDFVTVLRRAIFNGPLHIRTNLGGEFAIDYSLAKVIKVCK